jgi:adenylate kinase family enzyme
MTQGPLKVCIVGPPNSGKTLLAKTLADQAITYGSYSPTKGVRYADGAGVPAVISCSERALLS